jgi:hypothetical protein
VVHDAIAGQRHEAARLVVRWALVVDYHSALPWKGTPDGEQGGHVSRAVVGHHCRAIGARRLSQVWACGALLTKGKRGCGQSLTSEEVSLSGVSTRRGAARDETDAPRTSPAVVKN